MEVYVGGLLCVLLFFVVCFFLYIFWLGAWLNAPLISSLCHPMNDEAVRIAIVFTLELPYASHIFAVTVVQMMIVLVHMG